MPNSFETASKGRMFQALNRAHQKQGLQPMRMVREHKGLGNNNQPPPMRFSKSPRVIGSSSHSSCPSARVALSLACSLGFFNSLKHDKRTDLT